MKKLRVALLTCAAFPFWAAPAGAYALKGTVYVSPAGSDSNSCLTTQTPCKTITHAISLTGGAAWDVQPAAGTYYENVVVTKGGDATAPMRVIPVAGTRVDIVGTGKGPIGLDVSSVNYVNFTGVYFHEYSGDCVYVHGADSTHHQVNLHLNLVGAYNCGGYTVHAEHTDLFDDGYGRTFDASGTSVVYMNDSPSFHFHDQNLYNLPPTYPVIIGAKIVNSPNGSFEGVNGKISGVTPTLDAESSPFMSIVNNNPPAPNQNTFTCTINPSTDRATDTISGNGTGCQ